MPPKRQQQRRRQSRPTSRARRVEQAPKSSSRIWLLVAAAAGILIVLALLGRTLFHVSSTATAPAPTATSGAVSQAQVIDGIPCYQEMLTYHVHAHLLILDRGQKITVPAYVGINLNQECLYWLHTHDASGVIHIEAPHKINPTLGEFFDIWGQPLSRHQVASAIVGKNEQLRAYVNGKLYNGNPRSIHLEKHTVITLEIGPPFEKPHGFDFAPYD